MIKRYLRKIIETPPNRFVPLAKRKISDKIDIGRLKWKYLYSDARLSLRISIIGVRCINLPELDTAGLDQQVSKHLVQLYLDHRFDLLGSGWIKNSFFSTVPGIDGINYRESTPFAMDAEGTWLGHVVGRPHERVSKLLFQKIDKNYVPIDWQKDFKSGFRWDPKRWHSEQRAITPKGADIKVPWELSRLQHLPQLALFAKALPARKRELVLEFKNQVLDFIATNPPNMGVCWVCAMDVGIRAANLLVAYDLFTQLDDSNDVDAEFGKIFAESIYEHGKYILYNLEYSEKLTSNHYLSDVAGLLFIAAYLEETSETNTWLGFSIAELVREFEKQFYADGTNFEASTSYHRLSSELIVYSVALIQGLSHHRLNSLRNLSFKKWPYKVRPKPLPFPTPVGNNKLFSETFTGRLLKAGMFSFHCTKATGEIAQIGDNDSGRFFRLSPNGTFLSNEMAEGVYLNLKGYGSVVREYEKTNLFWDENQLNHETLHAMMGALFRLAVFEPAMKRFPLEASVVKSLAKDQFFKTGSGGDATVAEKRNAIPEDFLFRKAIEVKPVSGAADFLAGIKGFFYRDSGFYILRSNRVFAFFSAGPNGQLHNGGHAHNDKLSIELSVDGVDLALDPGTYLYTPSASWRNSFRSVAAHATLQTGMEQNDWIENAAGLFSLRNESTCEVVSLSLNEISVRLTYKDVIQIRTLAITPDKILISDQSNVEFSNSLRPFEWFSNGYGKIRRFSTELTNFEINYRDLTKE